MLRPMPKDPFVRTLAAAADQSIVACGAQQTVIAGYHWFSDWGREYAATGCSPPAKRACS
jgi:glycogen debranching enzyme